ncbi:MAG: hypothetical protein P4M15_00190 [Alphaproteobacteria bacterium]|nr:hypothetical protein [Alphaproteobacteria bacterium]
MMAQGKKTGGRVAGTPNKATAQIKTLAGAYSAEAVDILISVARNADSDAAKVAACRELLDRGHGKASQRLDVDANINAANNENALLEGRRRAAASRLVPSTAYASTPTEYENNIE